MNPKGRGQGKKNARTGKKINGLEIVKKLSNEVKKGSELPPGKQAAGEYTDYEHHTNHWKT